MQTGRILEKFEQYLLQLPSPTAGVAVVGDVNSTLACALAAVKLGIPVAHIEAGLRSFDRTMPEEINRIATDAIADLLLVSEPQGEQNLLREGVEPSRICYIGNVMIDTLVRMLPHARVPDIDLPPRYILVTLHRPSNVDDLPWLEQLLQTLAVLSDHAPVLFPVHPRTAKALNDLPKRAGAEQVRLLEPLPYLPFLALQQKASLVITDSGGIQEETTFLGIPCLTVRENTERPITVEYGTNLLVGRDLDLLRESAHRILGGEKKQGRVPALWDGRAAERIAEIVSSR
jgi:UDP-N-acetylglucosamine 2-epimerase (non-hydrolysing)